MIYGARERLTGKGEKYKMYNAVDCPNDNTKCITLNIWRSAFIFFEKQNPITYIYVLCANVELSLCLGQYCYFYSSHFGLDLFTGVIQKDSATNDTLKSMEALQSVKSEIIRVLTQVTNDDWVSFHLIIEAAPFTNKGYKMMHTFLNQYGTIKASLKIDELFSEKVYDLIFQMNQNQHRNEIIFFTKRDDYANASIFTSFSSAIDEAFQSRLPKSLRGKTVPWYKTEKQN
jgi:hypothetical protein